MAGAAGLGLEIYLHLDSAGPDLTRASDWWLPVIGGVCDTNVDIYLLSNCLKINPARILSSRTTQSVAKISGKYASPA